QKSSSPATSSASRPETKRTASSARAIPFSLKLAVAAPSAAAPFRNDRRVNMIRLLRKGWGKLPGSAGVPACVVSGNDPLTEASRQGCLRSDDLFNSGRQGRLRIRGAQQLRNRFERISLALQSGDDALDLFERFASALVHHVKQNDRTRLGLLHHVSDDFARVGGDLGVGVGFDVPRDRLA